MLRIILANSPCLFKERCYIVTWSGDGEGSDGVDVEEDVQLSVYSSSIKGSKVRLGNNPLIADAETGGVINNSSIISSVSSPVPEDNESS